MLLADRLLELCLSQHSPGTALGALLVAAGVVSCEQARGAKAVEWDEPEARKNMGMMFNMGREVGLRMRETKEGSS